MQALGFLVLARLVGPEALGRFGLAQEVANYGSLAVQRGLDVPAMLRVSHNPDQSDAVRAAVVRLRLPVALVLIIAAAIWGNPLLLAMTGVWLAAAVQIRWLLLARQQSLAAAGSTVIAAAVFLAATVAGLPLVWVAAALSAGEILGAAWCWFAGGSVWRPADGLAGELQTQAWPFLAGVLLGNLLYSLDIFVLGAIRGGLEVGLYVAAYRLITVFSPVLGALQNSSLPLFGKLYPDGPAAAALANTVWTKSAGAAAAIALGLALTPSLLLPLLYGDGFSGAIRVVPVFAVVLPIQVTRMVYRQGLLAFRGEHRDLRNLTVAVALNLILALALAPSLGALGCAFATLGAELWFAVATWYSFRKVTCP